MDTSQDPRSRPPGRPGGAPVAVLLGLSGLAWGFGTPSLWFASVMTSAPFFGETPTEAELAAARRLLHGALACGLAVPLAALVLALVTRRGTAAALVATALVLSLAAGAATGVLGGVAREWRQEAPPDRGPRPCVELSGGDNRCPGG